MHGDAINRKPRESFSSSRDLEPGGLKSSIILKMFRAFYPFTFFFFFLLFIFHTHCSSLISQEGALLSCLNVSQYHWLRLKIGLISSFSLIHRLFLLTCHVLSRWRTTCLYNIKWKTTGMQYCNVCRCAETKSKNKTKRHCPLGKKKGFMLVCLFTWDQLDNPYKEKCEVICVGSLWQAVNTRLSTLPFVGCADVGSSLKNSIETGPLTHTLPHKYVHLTRAAWRAEKRQSLPLSRRQPASQQGSNSRRLASRVVAPTTTSSSPATLTPISEARSCAACTVASPYRRDGISLRITRGWRKRRRKKKKEQ